MAPILVPPSVSIEDTKNKKNAVKLKKKKKTKAKKVSVTQIEEVAEDVATKPLPQLIQEVIEAMEIEETRLKKEEEEFLKVNEARLNKPPAATPPSFSPLDASLPPLPPPKDDVEFKQEEIVSEPELEEVEPEPERLSLEEDYPNRTVNPDEIISFEYRERNSMLSNQWYFDEYSGLYRQNAHLLHQSLPDIRVHAEDSTENDITHLTEKLLRSNTTVLNSRPPSLALRLKLSKTGDTQSIKSSLNKVSSNMNIPEDDQENWPIPTTVEEVKALKKKVRSMRNRRKQLDLCRLLMDTACRGETNIFVNESPIPGTPPVNTRYRQQELRKKKKKDLMLEEVLVLEAQKILKRLAGGAVGHDTDGDAQFLLANCYGVGGLGLPLDRERAFALFIHASKQNHPESTYRAAVCYELGIGTKRDYTRAMIYYRKAATLSHVASMYKLGIILLRGFCGQVVNVREAMTWLQRAAALATAQNPHSLYVLAMFQFIEEFTHNTNMIADASYALELLHESARFQYLPSQVKLGELYEVGGPVEVDDALSIYWYTKAAEQGDANAALALSSWYLTGSSGILSQSDREAYLWARKAAACQDSDRWTIAKAYFLVGMYVDRKIGVDDYSIEDATVWFKRSAALGHKGAIEIIEKSLSSPNANNTTIFSSSTTIESN